MNAAIGTLCRDGRTVFYAYVAGVYREGSVAHLTALLDSWKAAPKTCGACGDVAPVGQSCICFDNGCQ